MSDWHHCVASLETNTPDASHRVFDIGSQFVLLNIDQRLVAPTSKVRAYNHLLGETGTTFMAAPIVAVRCRGRFPHSLNDLPLLPPADNTAIRRDLDEWLRRQALRPIQLGEFENFALLREFGEAGTEIFPVPSVLERKLQKENGLEVLV